MKTKTNLPSLGLWLAVCVIAGVMGVYTIGYFWLCERWGTAILQEAADGFQGAAVTLEGPPFLDRMYPNGWYAKIFSPAAILESWLTNVEVRAVDRSNIIFDFTMDDNTGPAPTAPDSPPVLETPSETIDLASLGITVDSDGFVLCEMCQRRLSAVINRGGYLLTCRTCKTDFECCLWSEVGPSWHDSIDVYREGEETPMLTGVASEIWEDMGKLAEEGNVIAMPAGFRPDN